MGLNKWIPIEEKLPNEKGEYLVTYHPCHWDNVSEKVCVGLDSFKGKTSWAKTKYQRVIAWQPLPKPYGEEMKMNAEEMFEILGYIRAEYPESIDYDCECGISGWKHVSFDKHNKTVCADENYEIMNIEMDTLKAITQQCKEMGWLDE